MLETVSASVQSDETIYLILLKLPIGFNVDWLIDIITQCSDYQPYCVSCFSFGNLWQAIVGFFAGMWKWLTGLVSYKK